MGQSGLLEKCKNNLKLIISNDSSDTVISKAILECLPLFLSVILSDADDKELLVLIFLLFLDFIHILKFCHFIMYSLIYKNWHIFYLFFIKK